jgi:hypothetical protein
MYFLTLPFISNLLLIHRSYGKKSCKFVQFVCNSGTAQTLSYDQLLQDPLANGWMVLVSNPGTVTYFSFPITVHTGPGTHPASWVFRFFTERKRAGRKINHPTSSCAEVKSEGSITRVLLVNIHCAEDYFLTQLITPTHRWIFQEFCKELNLNASV